MFLFTKKFLNVVNIKNNWINTIRKVFLIFEEKPIHTVYKSIFLKRHYFLVSKNRNCSTKKKTNKIAVILRSTIFLLYNANKFAN